MTGRPVNYLKRDKETRKFILFFMFMITIIIIFFLMNMKTNMKPKPYSNPYDQTEEKQKEQLNFECVENQTMECELNGCEGIKICLNGKWSPCRITMECVPGQTIGCHYDQCRYGIRTCDRCGKWGPCKLKINNFQ